MNAWILFITLGLLAFSCLVNLTHAKQYRESWSNTLIIIAACAVAAITAIPRYRAGIPFEFILPLIACLYQNASMAYHSYLRKTDEVSE